MREQAPLRPDVRTARLQRAHPVSASRRRGLTAGGGEGGVFEAVENRCGQASAGDGETGAGPASGTSFQAAGRKDRELSGLQDPVAVGSFDDALDAKEASPIPADDDAVPQGQSLDVHRPLQLDGPKVDVWAMEVEGLDPAGCLDAASGRPKEIRIQVAFRAPGSRAPRIAVIHQGLDQVRSPRGGEIPLGQDHAIRELELMGDLGMLVQKREGPRGVQHGDDASQLGGPRQPWISGEGANEGARVGHTCRLQDEARHRSTGRFRHTVNPL